jgi:hypothetical protein
VLANRADFGAPSTSRQFGPMFLEMTADAPSPRATVRLGACADAVTVDVAYDCIVRLGRRSGRVDVQVAEVERFSAEGAQMLAAAREILGDALTVTWGCAPVGSHAAATVSRARRAAADIAPAACP